MARSDVAGAVHPLWDRLDRPTGAITGVDRPTEYLTEYPIFVCVLGPFRVLKAGEVVTLRPGGKAEALFCNLALHQAQGIARERLLDLLWPDNSLSLASQSLNSLVYSLHRLLGDQIAGASPVVHTDGTYRLNTEAGIGIDMLCFEHLASVGDDRARAGAATTAAHFYAQAVRLYGGDLNSGTDLHASIERERLRSLYHTLLARLAQYHLNEDDYSLSLEYALRLLANDPCREDAHRLAMQCYVRRGERAQALRQYRLCEAALRAEFDATPEPATIALFEQVRLAPDRI